jgi:superfamily I DNA/RNA helicase
MLMGTLRREKTQFLFLTGHNRKPEVRTFREASDEIEFIGMWISDRKNEGISLHEIGVFVRSEMEADRAIAAAKKAQVTFRVLDESVDAIGGQLSICTMHLAKGLEFKAVAVMACERIESVTEESDLQEVYNTERHLLYVACTRARDFLVVTGLEPASEFLDDIKE